MLHMYTTILVRYAAEIAAPSTAVGGVSSPARHVLASQEGRQVLVEVATMYVDERRNGNIGYTAVQQQRAIHQYGWIGPTAVLMR